MKPHALNDATGCTVHANETVHSSETVHASGDDLLSELLGHARQDAPAASAQLALLVALGAAGAVTAATTTAAAAGASAATGSGVGASASTAASAASAATASTLATAGSSLAPPTAALLSGSATKVSLILGAKWLVGAALATTVAAGAYVQIQTPHSSAPALVAPAAPSSVAVAPAISVQATPKVSTPTSANATVAVELAAPVAIGTSATTDVAQLAVASGTALPAEPVRRQTSISPTSKAQQLASGAHVVTSAPSSDSPAAPIPAIAAVESATPLPAATAVGASQLAAETQLLELARRALAAGDNAAAARAIDQYRSRFPRGELAREAEILRARTTH